MNAPRTEVVTLRLTPTEREALTAEAYRRGMSFSKLLRETALMNVTTPDNWLRDIKSGLPGTSPELPDA